MRLAHTQVWPALRNLQAIAPETAASMSASSNTINGALPPSSIEVFLMVEAHCACSCRPTAVEPVKLNFFTVSLSVSTRPISRDEPVITLNTPAGMPARSAKAAMASAENGVCEAGRMMKVQPAASAGAALRVIMALGKFHGVIAAHTPTGCLSTKIRLSGAGPGMVSPYTRLASSAYHSM